MSLRFFNSAPSGENSPLAGFDKAVAMQPAITAGASRTSPTTQEPTDPVDVETDIAECPADFCAALRMPSRSGGRRLASLPHSLVEKDREILRLNRQLQSAMDAHRQLKHDVQSRNEKIHTLEKDCEAFVQKQSQLSHQLSTARTELIRLKRHALTTQRKQQQCIDSLSRKMARNLGFKTPGARMLDELVVKSGDEVSGRANMVQRQVLKAICDAETESNTKHEEATRLVVLCEKLERAFGMDSPDRGPENVFLRLEIAVECATELLDLIVNNFETIVHQGVQSAEALPSVSSGVGGEVSEVIVGSVNNTVSEEVHTGHLL